MGPVRAGYRTNPAQHRCLRQARRVARGLAAIAIVAVAVVVVVACRGRRLLFETFDPDGAHAGIDAARLLTVHHAPFALTVIASIRVVGIVLVNALLAGSESLEASQSVTRGVCRRGSPAGAPLLPSALTVVAFAALYAAQDALIEPLNAAIVREPTPG